MARLLDRAPSTRGVGASVPHRGRQEVAASSVPQVWQARARKRPRRDSIDVRRQHAIIAAQALARMHAMTDRYSKLMLTLIAIGVIWPQGALLLSGMTRHHRPVTAKPPGQSTIASVSSDIGITRSHVIGTAGKPQYNWESPPFQVIAQSIGPEEAISDATKAVPHAILIRHSGSGGGDEIATLAGSREAKTFADGINQTLSSAKKLAGTSCEFAIIDYQAVSGPGCGIQQTGRDQTAYLSFPDRNGYIWLSLADLAKVGNLVRDGIAYLEKDKAETPPKP